MMPACKFHPCRPARAALHSRVQELGQIDHDECAHEVVMSRDQFDSCPERWEQTFPEGAVRARRRAFGSSHFGKLSWASSVSGAVTTGTMIGSFRTVGLKGISPSTVN